MSKELLENIHTRPKLDLEEINKLTKEAITVDVLNNVAQYCYGWKQRASELDKVKKEANIEKDIHLEVFGNLLDKLEITSFKTNFGSVSKTEQPNYRLPQDDDSRKKFFSYLKEKGVYDTMITINSRSLQSYVKQEVELSELDGNFDVLPDGIEETEYRTVYSLRK